MDRTDTGLGTRASKVAQAGQASAPPRWVLGASALLVFVGAVVLVGWWCGWSGLTRIHPAWPSMKVNTAVAVLLTGAALGVSCSSAPSSQQLRFGRILAAFVGLVGALSLAEYLLHLDLGIDELLRQQPEPDAPFPGRMAEATALALTLLGLALWGLHSKATATAWAARLAALVVGVLGLLAVVGYWYGVKGLHGVAAFSTISFHTALLLMVAAAGLLSVAPRRGPLHFLVGGGVGSRMARDLLPLAILLPLVTGWLRLLGQKYSFYGFEFGLALFATTNAISFSGLIWLTALRLERTDKERRRAESELAEALLEITGLNSELEHRVVLRTEELEKANTALRELTARLQRQRDDLECSVRDLDQFAYVASHDLQEPLRAVAGCAQILERRYQGKLDSGANELITHVVEGAERMRALILDLLAFSRLGSSAPPAGLVDSGAELNAARARLEASIEQTGAQLTNDALPTVNAVPGQLEQVFEHLLGNALKYRGAQQPRIHVTARRSGSDWEFAVSDNGIGIETQYFERIFTLFQRLHTREQYSGTGIGLALCRKIVERHAGKIWLDSAPAQGSTFRFTIPSGDRA